MIPVNERDIKLPDLERGVDGRLARELNDRFGASKNIVTAQALQLLEERNNLIKKYLTDVRARLRFSKVMEQNQQIQAIDVVKDIPLPVLSFDLDALTKLFAPRRKLRPQRQGPKVLAMHPDTCSLVVNIESAQGLPVRSGDGAFVDHAFNTTDVCLVMDTTRMNNRQRDLYTRERSRAGRG